MLFGTRKNPKGPNLDNPEQVVLDCSGTKISCFLPRSNFKQSNFEKDVNGINKGGDKIVLDSDELKLSKSNKDSYFGGILIRRVYNFYGLPFWNGELGGCNDILANLSQKCES
ncbi:hypothetical protein GCM10007877_08460 [Marinibactrum halimedae]|uniref:Uncharacterized protein n=1 Tax=Marinibactrum halimedae TaxID=1444977 RepID=A0AA37WNH9_9GAMM|nr:hypothetical protein GCM10007877_08460 [Marinibactrum halimedae]